VITPYAGVIDAMLRADVTIKAATIYERLLAEHGFAHSHGPGMLNHLRRVGKDCLVSFEASLYSVPARAVRARQRVQVRAYAETVALHACRSTAAACWRCILAPAGVVAGWSTRLIGTACPTGIPAPRSSKAPSAGRPRPVLTPTPPFCWAHEKSGLGFSPPTLDGLPRQAKRDGSEIRSDQFEFLIDS
jgi:hypothetical protein